MRIASLKTTDGHLRNVPIDFAPGLNCVIGARGTCKSTIIETIRFLFDDDAKRIEELLAEGDDSSEASHRGLIRATLGGGTARATLDVESGAGGTATIERDTSSKPRVYVDEVKVIDDPAVVLSAIEIYSQGELQEIAKSPAKRLALVDRPGKPEIDAWRGDAAALAEEISKIGPELRELRDAIEATEAAVHEGRPLQERLAQLRADRPPITPRLAELRVDFQRGEQTLQATEEMVRRFGNASSALSGAIDRIDAVASEAEALGDVDDRDVSEIAASIRRAADTSRRAAQGQVDPAELDQRLAAARTRFEERSQDYYEAMKRQEAVNANLRQEDRLTEEVEKLERLEAELTRHRETLSARERHRTQLRQRLSSIRTKIFQRRLEEVERINSEFSDQIVLVLKQGTQADNYREQLAELLEGSRIRERPALCRQLAAAFPPQVLITLVEEERAEDLAAALDRDPGQMTRLLAHLAAAERLYDLESAAQDDELEITMYVHDTARSVSEMSKGEMATAILPLLLRPADYPLVLDQPEDDLDNRFIFKTLAANIRTLKNRRQLIFVTHNANIPVIGDADKVLAMDMDSPTTARLLGSGNVEEMKDDIVDILEGGEDAFRLRSESYGI